LPLLAGITSFFDKYILGYAIGNAAGPSLEPFVQDLANAAWQLNQVMPPDAMTLALGVAQGQVDPDAAQAWASQTGFGTDQFKALVDIANVGPALGLAYQAWRRGDLSDAEFDTALKRTGLEEQWYAALRALKVQPLAPTEIATAVHRNIMSDPSLIVQEPPTTAGDVEQVPQSSLSPDTEASWSGIDHERLRVLVGITGLPPGLIEMLRLLNMGKVTVDDVQRAVAQSNLRNEYMDVVLNLRRHLLTPHEYEEAALRGIITNAQADAGAALSGMEPTDAQLLFQIMGRPLNVHAVTTGLARGGDFGGTYADVPEPYRDAIRRSNIRPEYARLAYANRYNYPSAFVLRSLAQAGELGDEKAVEQILLDIAWPPDLAAKVAPLWVGAGAGAAAAKPDPWVAKASNHLWTAVQKGYVGGSVDQTNAAISLDLIGVAATAQTEVFARWDETKRIEAL
jgi:hypothetical protein